VGRAPREPAGLHLCTRQVGEVCATDADCCSSSGSEPSTTELPLRKQQ
jgi:hypothetical protein